MAAERLFIMDYTGTSRSGKGTITQHLEQSDPNRIIRLETGIDYRHITYALLQEGILEPGTSTNFEAEAIDTLDENEILELLQDNKPDKEHLYSPSISQAVSGVASYEVIRKAVKSSFKKRVEAARDDDRIEMALTDGRNLASTLRGMPGVSLLMSSFVTCSPVEMKIRECARLGIDPTSSEAEKVIGILLAADKKDAQRAVDSVAPDVNAIDYWHFSDVDPSPIAEAGDSIYSARYKRIIHEATEAYLPLRLGIGTCAAVTDRQVYFDTTRFSYSPDPVQAMLIGAEIMFLEAALSHQEGMDQSL